MFGFLKRGTRLQKSLSARPCQQPPRFLVHGLGTQAAGTLEEAKFYAEHAFEVLKVPALVLDTTQNRVDPELILMGAWDKEPVVLVTDPASSVQAALLFWSCALPLYRGAAFSAIEAGEGRRVVPIINAEEDAGFLAARGLDFQDIWPVWESPSVPIEERLAELPERRRSVVSVSLQSQESGETEALMLVEFCLAMDLDDDGRVLLSVVPGPPVVDDEVPREAVLTALYRSLGAVIAAYQIEVDQGARYAGGQSALWFEQIEVTKPHQDLLKTTFRQIEINYFGITRERYGAPSRPSIYVSD